MLINKVWSRFGKSHWWMATLSKLIASPNVCIKLAKDTMFGNDEKWNIKKVSNFLWPIDIEVVLIPHIHDV